LLVPKPTRWAPRTAPLKVTTPELTVTVVVPLSVPHPGLEPKATVTASVLWVVTTFRA
jgi:hypothetical protein